MTILNSFQERKRKHGAYDIEDGDNDATDYNFNQDDDGDICKCKSSYTLHTE